MSNLLAIVVFAVSVVGAAGFVAWFFLRGGGVVENAREKYEVPLKSLQSSYLTLSQRLEEMDLAQKALLLKQEQFESSIKGRISSFESRFGKFAKREEQDILKEQAFDAIRHINQQ